MIKAIETVYNGYRFRSRLEARWAVFFDALGIEYEYESEGYELGDLGRYLPDFWLPVDGWHVEIKPSTVNDKDLERARYFDDHCPEESMGVIIVCGMPEIPKYFWKSNYNAPDEINTENRAVYIAYRCSAVSIYKEADQEKIINAVTLARSARFEYGQTPVVK